MVEIKTAVSFTIWMEEKSLKGNLMHNILPSQTISRRNVYLLRENLDVNSTIWQKSIFVINFFDWFAYMQQWCAVIWGPFYVNLLSERQSLHYVVIYDLYLPEITIFQPCV